MPVSTDVCPNGVAVKDPENNPGLVRDCEILLGSAHILAGDALPRLRWNPEHSIFGWRGITVYGDPPRVRGVELYFRGLVDSGFDLVILNGSLPAVLGDLTELKSLKLPRNELTGEIPASLGNLSNLEVLDLQIEWGDSVHSRRSQFLESPMVGKQQVDWRGATRPGQSR
jgi:hypothetical protein